MIHEIRTYDLKPRSTEEFGRRTAEKLPYRLGLSSLYRKIEELDIDT